MRHFGAVFRAIKIAPPPNQQLPASPVKSAFACILTATKNFGQLRKLSPIPGVLPRPIVSDPRKEYLSIFSRAIFSTPWYFRGRPNFAFLGRFEEVCGLVRPHVRICLPRRFGGLYDLTMYLSFSSRHPQYSHSNLARLLSSLQVRFGWYSWLKVISSYMAYTLQMGIFGAK